MKTISIKGKSIGFLPAVQTINKSCSRVFSSFTQSKMKMPYNTMTASCLIQPLIDRMLNFESVGRSCCFLRDKLANHNANDLELNWYTLVSM